MKLNERPMRIPFENLDQLLNVQARVCSFQSSFCP